MEGCVEIAPLAGGTYMTDMPKHPDPILDPADAAWSDERGWGLRVFEGGVPPESIRECHAVSIRPGAVRGNHRHPGSTEWMVLMGGPFTVAWRDPVGQPETRAVAGEGPTVLRFGPGVAHAVRFDGEEGEGVLVAFSDARHPETERVDGLL